VAEDVDVVGGNGDETQREFASSQGDEKFSSSLTNALAYLASLSETKKKKVFNSVCAWQAFSGLN
jgi:hypothetical protein